jgi:hypothetical protein
VRVIDQSEPGELVTNVQRFIAPFVRELVYVDSQERLQV